MSFGNNANLSVSTSGINTFLLHEYILGTKKSYVEQCAIISPVLLQYYVSITSILHQNYVNITSVLLQYYFSITSVLFQYYFSITTVLRQYYDIIIAPVLRRHFYVMIYPLCLVGFRTCRPGKRRQALLHHS
jgi:hypothetical protein